MATAINREPAPRLDNLSLPPKLPIRDQWLSLPRDIKQPRTDFLKVLQARRSVTGEDVGINDLSSLLWHSTALRERHGSGRFGIPWESRPAPSAGGLHPISIIVLPLGAPSTAGEYLPDLHGIAAIHFGAVEANRASVEEMLGCHHGTTLQFACDLALLDACYSNPETLMWRDSGALANTITLVATWLGLKSVILGRIGTDILSAGGMNGRLVGAGAVHIGSVAAGSDET